MRLLTTLAIVLAASTATADPLGLVDYDRLFIKHNANVEVSDNGEMVLNLPGNVAILRQPNETNNGGNITAVDFSKIGAVGCAASLYAAIEAVAKSCDGSFTPNQIAKLETYRGELLDYYADNTYPASSRASVQVAYDAYVASLAPQSPAACEAVSAERKAFFDFMTSDRMRPEFDALLSEPRLPVANPCL